MLNFCKAWNAELENQQKDRLFTFATALCNSVAVAVGTTPYERFAIRRELMACLRESIYRKRDVDDTLVDMFFPNRNLFLMTYEKFMKTVTVNTVYNVTLMSSDHVSGPGVLSTRILTIEERG